MKLQLMHILRADYYNVSFDIVFLFLLHLSMVMYRKIYILFLYFVIYINLKEAIILKCHNCFSLKKKCLQKLLFLSIDTMFLLFLYAKRKWKIKKKSMWCQSTQVWENRRKNSQNNINDIKFIFLFFSFLELLWLPEDNF